MRCRNGEGRDPGRRRRNGAAGGHPDRGEGIAPERLPHLFRRHAGRPGEKGGDGSGRGGSGLGLAICKGLVEAHGGRIRAERAAAAPGTTVTFTLPAADEEAAADYAPATTAEPGNIPRLIEKTRLELAVLDLVLPGVDGIELMRTLPGLADLPMIFVSAYGEGDTMARALEAGATDYIVKPFSPAVAADAVPPRRARPGQVHAPGDAGGPAGAAHGHVGPVETCETSVGSRRPAGLPDTAHR